LVFVNNLLVNEANPESNESVVSQHSGIFECEKGLFNFLFIQCIENNFDTIKKNC
jgi:hypothetical protein